MSPLSASEKPTDRARANEKLRPYVPRLVINWLRDDPTALHREVEGSLAFVDISGFTALSERLARQGKIGAELMRDTLNDVFIALLDTAYDDGAGLLKWGGDALLLLFDGPDHENRACHACWEMQKTLDRVGRLRAGGSTIVLRMSIGIHTGTFQFFLTGSVHRELLIAGPDATRTVTMEAIADAGEISISPELAARIDPALVGPPKEESLLLAAAPEVGVQRAPDVGDVSQLDLPQCMPLAVRAHVMLEKTEPEHRTITAAFIDMMDTDALLERLGIDGLARALDERIRTIQEVALRYEVPFYESDIGKASVKALLTAGAPSTTGHDEERMLRALREIMETPGEVAMRIGVNTGRVFTGDFGPTYRRSYRVFGDAINTAARVMSKAEAGQVLATEIVLERSRTAFETTPIEPFAAKGKSAPIRASIVGPVIGQREAELRETPSVGRERELETLLRVVEDARRSKGSIVDLSGGPGLGKTRLLQDLISRAGDVFVFHTRCEEYESSTPYFPLRAPFRAVLGLSPTDSAEAVEQRLRMAAQNVDATIVPWVPLLGVLLGVTIPHTPETRALDDRFIPERLADVMTRFLYTSLAGTTTMLVVEDAQHMDESSRDLLRRLARAGIERKQVLFVTHDGTGSLFDADESDELNALAFTLAPLTLQAAIDMVNAVTEDEPLPPHVVEEIARRAGGSPLFLFELLDVVRETGSVETLPDSVEAVVAADIDRLAPADRTVLRYAAVLGTSFDPLLLGAALQGDVELDDGVWSRLGDLVELDAVAGELRFRNTLIRDAAYEGLPFRRRRVLHGRVAEAIEATYGEEEVGALALHYSEAQRHGEAWRYCRLAGDRAKAIYANVEAGRFYERALAAGRRNRAVEKPALAAAYEQLAEARSNLGEYTRADDAFQAARRLYGPGSLDAGRMTVRRARLSIRLGQLQRAVRQLQGALRMLDGVDGPAAASVRSRLYTQYGVALIRQGRTRETVEWCRRAEEQAKLGHDDEALGNAYQLLDMALLYAGELDHATHSPAALAIYEQLDDLPQQALTLNNMGVMEKERSDWAASRSLYERARLLYQTTGDQWMASLAAYNLGEILVDQGRYDEAEPVLRDVLRVWRASATESDVAEVQRELAKLLARQGHTEQALELLHGARTTQLEAGQPGEAAATEVRIVEALVLAGDPNGLEAVDGLLELLATTEGAAHHTQGVGRLRAWALLQAGRQEEAVAAFFAALDGARERRDSYEALLCLDGLAAAGEPGGTSERARIALELGIETTPRFPVAAVATAITV